MHGVLVLVAAEVGPKGRAEQPSEQTSPRVPPEVCDECTPEAVEPPTNVVLEPTL